MLELRVVKEIEEFGSYLQLNSFGEPDILHQPNISIGVMWAIKLVASLVSEMPEEGRLRCESREMDAPVTTPLAVIRDPELAKGFPITSGHEKLATPLRPLSLSVKMV